MDKSKQPRTLLRDWLMGGRPPQPCDDAGAEAVLAEAWEQGLTGSLDLALPAGDGGWPPAARARLRAEHRRLVFEGVQRQAAGARARAVLAAAGIRSLPLKGMAVVERLYESVGERPMADVDLLAIDDWTAAAGALRDAGYAKVDERDHAAAFAEPVTGGLVELHRGLASCPRLHPIDREALWARSRPDGGGGRTPSAEDLLVQLSVHAAFQHGLALRLGQYLDFRRLLERERPEGARAARIAAAQRAEASVGLALEAAAALVGAPVDAALAAAFAPHVPAALRRRLGEWLKEPLSLLQGSPRRLAFIRWHLAAGRRFELLRATLAGGGPRRGAAILRLLCAPTGRRAVSADA